MRQFQCFNYEVILMQILESYFNAYIMRSLMLTVLYIMRSLMLTLHYEVINAYFIL